VPATVKLNLIEGSTLEYDYDYRQRTVQAHVKDIPTSDPNLVLDLARRAPGMPQIGDPHPADPLVKCKRHRVVGAADDQCWVTITYESARVSSGGATPTFVARDGTTLTPIQTQTCPGTRKPFEVRWLFDKNKPPLVDALTVNVQMPVRTLSLSGIVNEAQKLSIYQYVGCVNAQKFYGLDPGYWLFAGMENQTVDGGVTYGVTCQFVSKNYEDWSEWGLFRDQHTGKYVTGQDVRDAVRRVVTLPYQFGTIVADNAGVTRVGPYPMVDFSVPFPRFRDLPGAGFTKPFQLT
jgi:hypothetical protein